jgi:hypothetical protein
VTVSNATTLITLARTGQLELLRQGVKRLVKRIGEQSGFLLPSVMAPKGEVEAVSYLGITGRMRCEG